MGEYLPDPGRASPPRPMTKNSFPHRVIIFKEEEDPQDKFARSKITETPVGQDNWRFPTGKKLP